MSAVVTQQVSSSSGPSTQWMPSAPGILGPCRAPLDSKHFCRSHGFDIWVTQRSARTLGTSHQFVTVSSPWLPVFEQAILISELEDPVQGTWASQTLLSSKITPESLFKVPSLGLQPPERLISQVHGEIQKSAPSPGLGSNGIGVTFNRIGESGNPQSQIQSFSK